MSNKYTKDLRSLLYISRKWMFSGVMLSILLCFYYSMKKAYFINRVNIQKKKNERHIINNLIILIS